MIFDKVGLFVLNNPKIFIVKVDEETLCSLYPWLPTVPNTTWDSLRTTVNVGQWLERDGIEGVKITPDSEVKI